MRRVKINQTKELKDGERIVLCGWIKSKRVSKNFAFVMINDGSQLADMQIIVDAGTQTHSQLERCHTGGSEGLTGKGAEI